ncbi:MAG TPA: PAS domain S-box protein [Bryobacteraceae bacterium]|nr:PAS domain S-box protein [Bryobacteraceae bacterium]
MDHPARLDGRRSPADILESIADPVVAFDKEFRYTYVSRRAAEALGMTAEEMLGKSMWDLFPGDADTGFQEACRRAWESGRPVIVERRSNVLGTWVESYIYPFQDGASTQWRDITERKRTEQALAAQHELLRTTLRSIGDAVVATDAAGRITLLNPAAARLTGWTEEEAVGQPSAAVLRLVSQRTHELADDIVAQVLREERAAPLADDMALVSRQGREIPIEDSAAPIRDGLGQAAGVVLVFRDVEEKRRAAEVLQEREAFLQSFYDSAGVMRGIVEIDGEAIVHLSCNKAAAEMYGIDASEIAGKTGMETGASAEAMRDWLALYRQSRKTGQAVSAEYARRDAAGRDRWLLATASYLGDGSLGRPRFAYTILDLTDRRGAEEALRESRAKLEAALASMTDAVFIADKEGRYVEFNEAFARFYRFAGKDECARTLTEYPKLMDAFLPDGSVAPLDMWSVPRALRGETATNVEYSLRRKDTGESWVGSYSFGPIRDTKGEIVGAVVVARDITEQKQAEERLRQAQKLESLGLLAGGVAHDFNNLLVGIIGGASLAEELLPADHEAVSLIRSVVKTGEQAAHLTRQMLAYSGRGRFLLEALNLTQMIPEIVDLVRTSISKKIALHLDLASEMPSIEADRGQVQQVFMNLTLNAAEAIGSHDGLITIKTGVRQVDEAFLQAHPEWQTLQTGPFAYLEVRDTGSGMDEATKRKIFDPFFSTKFTGRGLGLAAVAGIMRGHRGAVIVESEPGRGSMFTAFFPASAAPAGRGASVPVRTALRGSGTVLIVDDEAVVRAMAKTALERHGYAVLIADGGEAAVDLCKRHPGEIALVILDLSMPRMSGEEALPALRRIRPDIKVLISSGFSEAEAMSVFAGQRVSGFVQKPYTATRLAERVKLALA